MAHKKIETIINDKIAPYSLNERGKAELAQTIRKYPYELLIECIDIGIERYFCYDEKGTLTQESVGKFLDKLGGIAYNKSKNPIDQEISHIKNKCKKIYAYWNDFKAEDILAKYILALRKSDWTDNQILNDLKTEVNRLSNSSTSWSQWFATMEKWIEDINHWGDEDSISIEQDGTVLPSSIFENLSQNIQSLCKQINASYENNLFDCTAVMMRRLLEGLLVLSYQNLGVEKEITEKNGRHLTLDKIIKNAEQNTELALSANTRKDMAIFKDLGNYSAHKIWYNSTQQDIKPHILKYRVIIEELMYKAGLK
ncbi:hypothetical protein [Ethanoligenens harbinense]|uniref:DUF4145 domain-containing protein n=1 Tax=Ethanoligenens harbinense (strain DSM 18485 / JCM 12961 / CGMCC 1.5033 / YUAN-3) TaxID=663278 RepID=E6U3U3_ETHHY|nr:hypothetical protein [Ethanoligenens harbinense]ADU26510.1 hypothetical protein Ethha_0954 [Ethanoligenens harbinense YUAN-3]AVQ95635.1 hypothetical protein CXQ68_04945 [Ethanoligenens harbinense YUAN-3]AYF38299.1 hypothetical protein CXP51_04805 [Ethanoligenens harbinense]AYF41045.1 hypothetical protein CN246_04940 [Ethanoligenens harbinense]QCN91876.1 hypothetical protein DRA42_04960 [Ethanoligenens harbinense]